MSSTYEIRDKKQAMNNDYNRADPDKGPAPSNEQVQYLQSMLQQMLHERDEMKRQAGAALAVHRNEQTRRNISASSLLQNSSAKEIEVGKPTTGYSKPKNTSKS